MYCSIWNEGVIIAVVFAIYVIAIKPKKKVFGASTGFKSMTSALVLEWSTDWAMMTHTLGAGQFVEFIVPVKGTKHMNIMWTADIQMKVSSSQLRLQFKQSQLSPNIVLGASTGFEPMAAAVLYKLSADDPYVGSRPICWVHRTRERNETWILCELQT